MNNHASASRGRHLGADEIQMSPTEVAAVLCDAMNHLSPSHPHVISKIKDALGRLGLEGAALADEKDARAQLAAIRIQLRGHPGITSQYAPAMVEQCIAHYRRIAESKLLFRDPFEGAAPPSGRDLVAAVSELATPLRCGGVHLDVPAGSVVTVTLPKD